MDQFDVPQQNGDDTLPDNTTESTETKPRKPSSVSVDYKTLYEDLLYKINRKDGKTQRRQVDLDLDPSDVDLIQLAHSSYLRELNKYNI